MLSRISFALVAALPIFVGQAAADELPMIKLMKGNAVPACATAGRMMAYLKSRNNDLDARYGHLARHYKDHGEALGIRWDYAFFQMIVETGALKFRRGNGSPSDVKPLQNNFAGLGATGNGESGEAFDDISSGVKAHLQHLLLYAGHKVDDPVAERTRKVQEWGILTSWQKKMGRPITYGDLAKKWAPGSRGYARDIEAVGRSFFKTHCKIADPDPQADQPKLTVARAPDLGESQKPVRDRPRIGAMGDKSALGAGDRASGELASGVDVAVLNVEEKTKSEMDSASLAETAKAKALTKGDKVAVAPAPPKTMAPSAEKPAASAKKKCRVWTASYGGQKAVLIQSETDEFTNYTVLDVNQGKEQRESDAYIAAYAKGGRKVADFGSQTQALTKAFELCPDG